jgi:hypothetical protein
MYCYEDRNILIVELLEKIPGAFSTRNTKIVAIAKILKCISFFIYSEGIDKYANCTTYLID